MFNTRDMEAFFCYASSILHLKSDMYNIVITYLEQKRLSPLKNCLYVFLFF